MTPPDDEDRFYDWLRARAARQGFERLGDDAAILPPGGSRVVTMDQQIEGVHFPRGLDPRLIAARLLRVNLSDLAAMGALPEYAFLALSGPNELDRRRFLSAFLSACERFGVELAGGDLARHDRVHATVTLLGRRPEGGRWLTRGGGRPGDRLWLAGELGLSAVGRQLLEAGATVDSRRVVLPPDLGLSPRLARLAKSAVRAHVAPRPQLEAGVWVGQRRRAAAIDLSDGLAIDLHRLCRESGVGAHLAWEALPRSRAFDALCQALDIDPAATLLGGGEDYALLFALAPPTRPPSKLRCRAIGVLQSSRAVILEQEGSASELPPLGWDHFSSAR